MTQYNDAESLEKVPFKTVFIPVSVQALASVMRQRFTGEQGVLSIQSVDLRFDEEMQIVMAMPNIVIEQGV